MFEKILKSLSLKNHTLPPVEQVPVDTVEVKQRVIEILDTVKEPHFDASLYALKMITDDDIFVSEDGIVRVKLRIMCVGCALPHELIGSVKSAIKKVPLVRKVEVDAFQDPEYELPEEIRALYMF